MNRIGNKMNTKTSKKLAGEKAQIKGLKTQLENQIKSKDLWVTTYDIFNYDRNGCWAISDYKDIKDWADDDNQFKTYIWDDVYTNEYMVSKEGKEEEVKIIGFVEKMRKGIEDKIKTIDFKEFNYGFVRVDNLVELKELYIKCNGMLEGLDDVELFDELMETIKAEEIGDNK